MELADKDFKTVINICKNLKASIDIKKRKGDYNRETNWVIKIEYNIGN